MEGVLRTRHVAALSFALTCAGPFGIEECVRTGGAPWTLVGFVAVTLVYVLPQILMTSELSLTLPLNNGGIAAWSSRAFGPKVGSCAALNMLVYQLVDLATYPTLAAGYCQSVGSDFFSRVAAAVPLLVVAIGLAANLLSLDVASDAYLLLLLCVLLPFVVGVPLALPRLGTAIKVLAGEQPATTAPPTRDLNAFLSTLFWLSTGWDSIGNVACEVAGPRHMIGGMLLAALAAWALYSVILVTAVGAGPGSWEDGYLATAFGSIWPPLAPWIGACACLANSLLYVSELTTAARLLQSLSTPSQDYQLLPSVLSRSTRSGAPAAALVAASALEACLSMFTFDYLVQLSTLLHTVTLWAALAAFLRSRALGPDLDRQYEVPGGCGGAMGIFAVKAPVLLGLLLAACTKPSVICGAGGINAVFFLLVGCRAFWNRRRRLEESLAVPCLPGYASSHELPAAVS